MYERLAKYARTAPGLASADPKCWDAIEDLLKEVEEGGAALRKLVPPLLSLRSKVHRAVLCAKSYRDGRGGAYAMGDNLFAHEGTDAEYCAHLIAEIGNNVDELSELADAALSARPQWFLASCPPARFGESACWQIQNLSPTVLVELESGRRALGFYSYSPFHQIPDRGWLCEDGKSFYYRVVKWMPLPGKDGSVAPAAESRPILKPSVCGTDQWHATAGPWRNSASSGDKPAANEIADTPYPTPFPWLRKLLNSMTLAGALRTGIEWTDSARGGLTYEIQNVLKAADTNEATAPPPITESETAQMADEIEAVFAKIESDQKRADALLRSSQFWQRRAAELETKLDERTKAVGDRRAFTIDDLKEGDEVIVNGTGGLCGDGVRGTFLGRRNPDDWKYAVKFNSRNIYVSAEQIVGLALVKADA